LYGWWGWGSVCAAAGAIIGFAVLLLPGLLWVGWMSERNAASADGLGLAEAIALLR